MVNATSVAGRVSGRLELFHQGIWKPACAAGFSNAASTVVCKQVGGWRGSGDGSEVQCVRMHVLREHQYSLPCGEQLCSHGRMLVGSCPPLVFLIAPLLLQLKLGTAGAALPNNAFGRGASGARLASIQCKGSEANWEACRAAVWASTPCGAQGDVAVSCTSPAGRWPGCGASQACPLLLPLQASGSTPASS